MGRISGKRILAGGVVAGLVLLGGEALIELSLGSAFQAWLQQLGRPAPGEAVFAVMLAIVLAIGTLAVWLYAGLRPRYGPGPRTALRVGLALWALTCLIPDGAMLAYGLLPASLFWPRISIYLVTVCLAALAGARLYREAGETAWNPASTRHAQPVA